MTYLVVGSGPAGIACAQGLLENGASVTMLDIGVACEPERAALVARLRAMPPEQWDPAGRRAVSAQYLPGSAQGFPVKLVFGSEFPYVPAEAAGVEQQGTRCVQSWAEGGLSNVWGAAMLPFLERDIDGWPFSLAELEPHYRAVARLTGMSGERDALEELFPFYGDPAPALAASSQAKWILSRLEGNARALRARGLRFGRSRLAARAGNCCLCQFCLTGCVYDAIYCTTQTLREFQRAPQFTYVKGARVVSCRDDARGAAVTYRDTGSGALKTLHGRRAFVAAGALSTTRILMTSLGVDEAMLELRFHPYFLAPMLMLRNRPEASREKLHALAQVFMEIMDPGVSMHTVHVQMYTYNPLFAERLGALGALAKLANPLLLGRLVALQGYLHSSESDPIKVHAMTDPATGESRLRLAGALSDGARRVMRRAHRKLARSAFLTGLVPIPFAFQAGAPGEGNHIGCVFPMSRTPRGFESDVLGRVGGLARVHAVDASVFPSIPSTTITYSAMANAHRIATAALGLE